VIVSAAVWILRITDPDAPRPFRAPCVALVATMGILVNGYMMFSLGTENWVRLFVWLVLGLCIYFGYGRAHSVLRQRTKVPVRTEVESLSR
jgi:basic amino acid/polyamine antiporter, APA family